MKNHEFQSALIAHPEKTVRFGFSDGRVIPVHAHVTEVGRVQKDFMDCGGTLRRTESCVLQVWVASDTEHRLDAGKLSRILDQAGRHFPIRDLSLEVEYEEEVISQFPVESFGVEENELWFRLSSRHTDCLAKESCGLEEGCCGSETADECCAGA